MTQKPFPRYIDVIPFSYEDGELRVLMLHRSPDNTYPNVWQPVAGKIKAGEKAWEAGLRELQEETGFIPQAFYAVDHVSTYYLHEYDRIIQVPVFAAQVAFQDPVISHEHSAFQWGSAERAMALATWEPYRQAIQAMTKMLESSPALALANISL